MGPNKNDKKMKKEESNITFKLSRHGIKRKLLRQAQGANIEPADSLYQRVPRICGDQAPKSQHHISWTQTPPFAVLYSFSL